MLAEMDKVCSEVGVWPHAVLAGHAHNYQRFTRFRGETHIPYVICGNGGHLYRKLRLSGVSRVPQVVQEKTARTDRVVFESYDDQDYGYLRIVVDDKQLHIEYHPASDGAAAKTPDDRVTIDLEARRIDHYSANDLGWPGRAKQARARRTP